MFALAFRSLVDDIRIPLKELVRQRQGNSLLLSHGQRPWFGIHLFYGLILYACDLLKISSKEIATLHLIWALVTAHWYCGTDFFTWGIRKLGWSLNTYPLVFDPREVWACTIWFILYVVMLLLDLRLGTWFSRLWWILWIMHCVALCYFFVATLESVVYIWGFLILISSLLLVLHVTWPL